MKGIDQCKILFVLSSCVENPGKFGSFQDIGRMLMVIGRFTPICLSQFDGVYAQVKYFACITPSVGINRSLRKDSSCKVFYTDVRACASRLYAVDVRE